MADFIDRDAVLHDVSTECSNAHEAKYYEAQVALTRAKRIIRDAPAVNRWIPCSDRLPEQGQRVIVQFQYNSAKNHTAISSAQRTYSGVWIVDVMRYADKDCVTVQAWMPMPDAYKPTKGGEHNGTESN